MNDDQFMKLFRYIEDFRSEVNEKFEQMATKDSVDRLTATVDALIGYYKEQEAEQAARDAQWNRLIEWAREVSKKTGVPMPDL